MKVYLDLTLKKNAADVLNSLVNIYDSVDVFVKEFQLYLSSRLLAIYNYNHETEVAQLEMLKCRFGELTMQSCEIMVKDIEDSRRLDTFVHEKMEVFRFLIIDDNAYLSRKVMMSMRLSCPIYFGRNSNLPHSKLQKKLKSIQYLLS